MDLPSKGDPAMMLTNVLKGQEYVVEYAFVWLDITNVIITSMSIERSTNCLRMYSDIYVHINIYVLGWMSSK